jgi:hypothetical protein|tara:strand:- start:469 stop:897 length:429 start_codon:yes stop_codon:yes gene_type:complete
MENVRSTVWGKILIGVVFVAIAWAVLQDRRESARIEQLASLPPCRLAAEYVEWRLAFEESNPAQELTGSAAETFVDESEVFEQAVRSAQRVSQSRLLQELEDLTAIDSTRWIREEGDIDSFVEVMLTKCPDEVEGLMSGTKR